MPLHLDGYSFILNPIRIILLYLKFDTENLRKNLLIHGQRVKPQPSKGADKEEPNQLYPILLINSTPKLSGSFCSDQFLETEIFWLISLINS